MEVPQEVIMEVVTSSAAAVTAPIPADLTAAEPGTGVARDGGNNDVEDVGGTVVVEECQVVGQDDDEDKVLHGGIPGVGNEADHQQQVLHGLQQEDELMVEEDNAGGGVEVDDDGDVNEGGGDLEELEGGEHLDCVVEGADDVGPASVMELARDNCGFTFKTNSLGDKVYYCKHCDYKSEFIASLRDHLNAYHYKKPLSCTECTYQSYRFKNLNSHRHTKHRLGAMQCDQEKCTFKTILEDVLLEHYRRKHGLQREPSAKPKEVWAGPSIPSGGATVGSRVSLKGTKKPHRYRLDRNQRVYETERIDSGNGQYSYVYTCVFCGFQSRLVTVIKAHANKQHLKRQLRCPECSFETFYSVNLQVHMKKVHNIRAENCAVDGCKFRTLFNNKMQIHLITKHQATYSEEEHALLIPIYY